MSNETNSLLDELKNLNNVLKEEVKKTANSTISTTVSTVSSSLAPTVSGIPPFVLDSENLNDFILAQSQELVLTSLDTVKELKATILTTIDPKAMTGFADVVKATTAALDTLNSLNIEKHKAKTAKELKQIDIEGRKLIATSKKPNQTLNIIATREDIMRTLEQVEKKAKETPAIDADFEEVKPKALEKG